MAGEASSSSSAAMKVLDSNDHLHSTIAYISRPDFDRFGFQKSTLTTTLKGTKLSNIVQVEGSMFLTAIDSLQVGEICLNTHQRKFLRTDVGCEEVLVKRFDASGLLKLDWMSIDLESASVTTAPISAPKLVTNLKKALKGQITDQKVPARAFLKNIHLESIEQKLVSHGVGGLSSKFREIIVKAFAGRYLSQNLVQGLGYKHVKGMVLHGPPGTGKMLVARTMAKIFDANIKVINGPEVFASHYGESEKIIRNIFEESIEDHRRYGENSRLHFIVLDTLDSIAKVRGVAGSFDATGDRVVNQLLTVIDGFKEYNNLFLIGTTNRLDLIDQALLRPGRLELQLRVDLPDENGRLQILQIHSAKIREKGFVSHDVKLETIALKTFGWSGAQLEAVVRTAFANAMERAAGEGLLFIKEENIKVFISDFEKVIEQFDNASQKSAVEWLEKCRKNAVTGLDTFSEVDKKIELPVKQNQGIWKFMSCLLAGAPGSGKTTMAALIAQKGQWQYVNTISLDTLAGLSENEQLQKIVQIFEAARTFQNSFIILDDIEWLLKYDVVVPHCSSNILSTLLEQLKKNPPGATRLLVVGTTSQKELLKKMGIADMFSLHIDLHFLESKDAQRILEHATLLQVKDLGSAMELLDDIPIKELYNIIDMAATGIEEESSGRKEMDLESFMDLVKYMTLYVQQFFFSLALYYIRLDFSYRAEKVQNGLSVSKLVH